MRRPGHLAPDDARHLAEFGHEAVLGMQASRGVDEHHIHVTRHAGLDRIECDRGRVAARCAGNTGNAKAFGPDLQLRNGAGAIGIGGSEQHPLAVALQPAAELRHGGRLADTVDADHEHDRWTGGWPGDGTGITGTRQHIGQPRSQRQAQVFIRLELALAHAGLEELRQVERCRHAEVCFDQQPFNLLEILGIQPAGKSTHVGQREALDARPQ